MPRDSWEPWVVYEQLKVNAANVKAAPKDDMGTSRLTMTGIKAPQFRASAFRCAKTSTEWRAEQMHGGHIGRISIATQGLHTPRTTCLLKYVSLYRTPEGIPGLRFDYDQCQGGTPQMSIMIGLRKAPNHAQVPGLVPFIQDVCHPHSGRTAFLDFGNIPLATARQWASQADYQIMTNCGHNCFNDVSILTFLNVDDHFPTLPVHDSEWDWLVQHLPMPHPMFYEVGNLKDPCSTAVVPIHPEEYGCMKINRICLHFPELPGHNPCNRYCGERAPVTVSTTVPAGPNVPRGHVCMDCAWHEFFYAVSACFLLWSFLWSTSWACGACFAGDSNYYGHADYDPVYSQKNMGTARRMYERPGFGCSLYVRMFICLGLRTLIEITIVYSIVHFLDFLITKAIFQQDPCIKIFGFETGPRGSGIMTRSDLGFGWRFGSKEYLVTVWSNEVCPWRLVGLILVTWFTYWYCVCSFYLNGEVEEKRVTTSTVENNVRNAAGGGAGAAGLII
jgi:hypothetical protein